MPVDLFHAHQVGVSESSGIVEDRDHLRRYAHDLEPTVVACGQPSGLSVATVISLCLSRRSSTVFRAALSKPETPD